MDQTQRFALETARDIVIAEMSNSSMRADKEGGKNTADFFEEIYTRVLAIAQSKV